MFKNPWSDCVLKAEYDHRAREAGLRQERVGRAFAMPPVSKAGRLARLVCLVGLSMMGVEEGTDVGRTGSLDDSSICGLAVAVPFAGVCPR